MNVKYVTVPKCVDCQKDCEKADYTFFGESKVCKHGKGFIVCGIAPEKRKPLSDGTLELTESELKEFGLLVYEGGIVKVKIDGVGGVEYFIKSCNELGNHRTVYEVKAILYLAERFELIKEEQ